jgi:phospholipid transport system substrate-binding protein
VVTNEGERRKRVAGAWARRWVGAMVAASALTVATASWAGAGTDLVKAKQTALFDLLKKGGAESDKKIAGIFDELLDYNAIAEASLGSEWASRSDAEKKEFTTTLKELVQANYKKNLKKTLDFTITYVGEDGTNPVTVKTKATKAGSKDELLIDFKLQQKDGKWKVVDILPEGQSIVQSYRSQFVKLLKKDGFSALVKKMKEKAAKGEG